MSASIKWNSNYLTDYVYTVLSKFSACLTNDSYYYYYLTTQILFVVVFVVQSKIYLEIKIIKLM